MKSLFYLLIIITIMISCESRLDQEPISEATTETFYAIPQDFIEGVNSVYNSLRTYPDRQLNLSETRSDNLYAVSDGGVRDWEGINSFHSSIASNPYIEEAWGTNYNGIFKANEIIEQLRGRGEEILNADLESRIEGEARFLRAFYYFDLVRWFGKVPLIDEVVTANEALEIPRNDVSDIYDLIIDDLDFAIQNLPKSYDNNEDVGRVTNIAAQSLLALVYMTRSGPTYGIDGPGVDSGEWDKALDILNNILNDSSSGDFIDDYEDIYSYDNENNKEVIFDVQYLSGRSPEVGGSFAWLLTPDDWFKSMGENVQGGLTIRPVSDDLMDSFDGGDLRKSFSILSGFTTANGATENRPFFIKYIDLNHVPVSRTDWPINYIVFSYTELSFMRAECILNGAPGSQSVVNDIVNKVRDRAGLSTLSTVGMTELLGEKRKEFAGEGKRWHDLVRNRLVVDKMNDWIDTEDAAKNNQINNMDEDFIIYPIPQNQLDVKEGLYDQNPGY